MQYQKQLIWTYSWESLQCELGEGEGGEEGEGKEEKGGRRGKEKKRQQNQAKRCSYNMVSLQRNKYQADTIIFFSTTLKCQKTMVQFCRTFWNSYNFSKKYFNSIILSWTKEGRTERREDEKDEKKKKRKIDMNIYWRVIVNQWSWY